MPTRIAVPTVILTAGLVLGAASAEAQARRPVEIIKTPLQRYTPPPGLPPQGLGIDARETFGVIAKVVWAPAPNATSYVVNRRLFEDAACCNGTSGPLTTTSWTDTGLRKKGHYIFTVQVNYADGSVGSSELGVGSDGIRNPVLNSQDIGPGRVRLTWDNNIPGTSGFVITGPGMGTGKMVSGISVDTPLLPLGPQTWSIASVYSQGLGVLSPPAEWSSVTHNVSYGNGRYRIVLEGFKAIVTTAEDPFRNDGHGDEIFLTAQVNEYGANAGLVSSRMLRTPTFGDVQNFPGRVRAGLASPTGGIRAGDQYPAPVQYVSQLQPATTSNLPYLVWEGELSEIKGVVMLSPAVWESDLGDELFPHFATFHLGIAPNVPYRNQFQSYVPWTLSPGVIDTWHPQRSCPAASSGIASGVFVPPLGGWHDEPIDMNQDHSYCPTWVAINWRLANSLTNVNPASVVEIPFESPVANWKYILYVRIEKVPGASPGSRSMRD